MSNVFFERPKCKGASCWTLCPPCLLGDLCGEDFNHGEHGGGTKCAEEVVLVFPLKAVRITHTIFDFIQELRILCLAFFRN